MNEKQYQLLKAITQHRLVYVKDTDERVLVLHYEMRHREDRDEVKIIADIQFISDNPSERALRKVGATGVADPLPQMYIGHPAPVASDGPMIWKARVDAMTYLSHVPFGTPAAEVLFGKK